MRKEVQQSAVRRYVAESMKKDTDAARRPGKCRLETKQECVDYKEHNASAMDQEYEVRLRYLATGERRLQRYLATGIIDSMRQV